MGLKNIADKIEQAISLARDAEIETKSPHPISKKIREYSHLPDDQKLDWTDSVIDDPEYFDLAEDPVLLSERAVWFLASLGARESNDEIRAAIGSRITRIKEGIDEIIFRSS